MKRTKELILVLILLFSTNLVNAQIDMQIDPWCQPNCSKFLHHWQSDPNICTAIINSNLQNPDQVFLDVTIIENTKGQILYARSEILNLPQGPHQILINNTNYFNYSILNINPQFEQTILSAGVLPEGSYEICYKFLRVLDGLPIGENCTSFDISSPDPPELVYPGTRFEPHPIETNAYPNFQFTPINYTAGPVHYQVKVVEVLPNQTPQEAYQINPGHYETTLIDQYSFLYPESGFSFIPGNTYCWGVSSLSQEGFPLTGHTENFVFKFQPDPFIRVGNDVPNIVITSPGGGCNGSVGDGHKSGSIDVTFEATGSFDVFEIYIMENPCGKYPKDPPPPPSPPIPDPVPPKDPKKPVITGHAKHDTKKNKAKSNVTRTQTGDNNSGVTSTPTGTTSGQRPSLPPGWEWGPNGPHWTGEHPPEPPALPPGWEWGPLRPVYTGIGQPANASMTYFSDPINANIGTISTGAETYTTTINIENIVKPGAAYVLQVFGVAKTPGGSTTGVFSEEICDRFSPLDGETRVPVEKIPCPKEVTCFLTPSEDAAPAMQGGCATNLPLTIIDREDFAVLAAYGYDRDVLIWQCQPSIFCQETASKKYTELSSRVRWEWKILSGEGNFVEIGCLPELKETKGKRIMFEPPYVAIDSTKKTVIRLITKDDNPSQPKDGDVYSYITITTKRFRADSNKNHLSIVPRNESKSAGLPDEFSGTCVASGPIWKKTGELTKPSIELPGAPDNDKLAFNERVLLRASDRRDKDQIQVDCISALCESSKFLKDYEDNVDYRWKIVSGGGKFLVGSDGREVIYQAPTSGKEVKIQVEVFNPGGQINDEVPPPGEITLKLFEPGIFLEQTNKAWRPKLDTLLEVSGMQKKRVEGTVPWELPLAHMCCIPNFNLTKRSNEPGIALNWDDPSNRRRGNPDLLFQEKENKADYELFLAPDSLKSSFAMVYKKEKITGPEKATPEIFCEDWGAYGKLELKTSYYIKAETDTDKNPGTVPLDLNDNQIADGFRLWDKKTNGTKRPGTHDKDHHSSHSAANKGDGYSAYEEWRGFYQGARWFVFGLRNPVAFALSFTHVSTSPKVKDLFLVDQNNVARPNINYFLSSRVRPHWIVRIQMDADRVVNFNEKTHNLGKQHGLIVQRVRFNGGPRGRAVGGPGLPKDVTSVSVDPLNCTSGGAFSRNMLRRVVAHETSHACNVRHHGEGGAALCLRTVAGACDTFTYAWTGRQVSGVHNCYMRYSWSRYLCSVAAGGIVVTQCNCSTGAMGAGFRMNSTNDGIIGSILCNTATGSGINAGGACAGNATRGNCLGQVKVKDN